MPLVEATRDPAVLSDEITSSLVEALPSIVAEALTSTQVSITPKDVNIRVRVPGRFEVTEFDLQIIVSASFTADRQENLPERHQQLIDRVRDQDFLPAGIQAYIWLVLPTAKFGEFTT